MKKFTTSLICLTTYGLGITSAYAHGAHGTDSSLLHLFIEPQHAIGLIASVSLVASLVALRYRRQTAKARK